MRSPVAASGLAVYLIAACAPSSRPLPPLAASSSAAEMTRSLRAVAPPAHETGAIPKDQRVAIEAGEAGFVPKAITVTHGQPVTFAIHRTTRKKCLSEVIIYLTGGVQIKQALPFGETVEFTVTFDRPDDLGFSCGMKMYGGTITVQ